MKVVVDTNGLLNSIPKNSAKRWLYDAFIAKEFTWVFSNEILSEYAEMVASEYSERAMEIVLSILLTANNTLRFEPFYNWQLVIDDPDDNKFVDCAIGANVDYLVTDDKHIKKLLKIDNLFPPVPIITFEQFRKILLKNKTVF
jgi:uncharacterized protein